MSDPVFTATGFGRPDGEVNTNPGTTISERVTPSIDRFTLLAKAIGKSLRVAVPGIVQSFSPGPPATVTVQIALNEKIQWNVNGPNTFPINIQVQPMQVGSRTLGQGVLTDVPVVQPDGGGWSMTFPIQKGDECLVIFGDCEIDSWLQNGGAGNNTQTSRRHDVSDAIAVFGLRSTPRAIPNYSTTSVQLRNRDQSVVIDLAPDQITIKASTVIVQSTTATVTASNTATVQGGTVNVTGSSQVNISGNGSTIIEGKDFLHHSHTGVSTGGGTTGPVS